MYLDTIQSCLVWCVCEHAFDRHNEALTVWLTLRCRRRSICGQIHVIDLMVFSLMATTVLIERIKGDFWMKPMNCSPVTSVLSKIHRLWARVELLNSIAIAVRYACIDNNDFDGLLLIVTRRILDYRLALNWTNGFGFLCLADSVYADAEQARVFDRVHCLSSFASQTYRRRSDGQSFEGPSIGHRWSISRRIHVAPDHKLWSRTKSQSNQTLDAR